MSPAVEKVSFHQLFKAACTWWYNVGSDRRQIRLSFVCKFNANAKERRKQMQTCAQSSLVRTERSRGAEQLLLGLFELLSFRCKDSGAQLDLLEDLTPAVTLDPAPVWCC